MFTTPCFIRKNTLELHKKLRELEYREFDTANLENPDTKYLCSDKGVYFTITPGCELDYVMDCGTNEDLFLAVSALRDDSDINQWFCDDKFAGSQRFAICKQNSWKEHFNHVTDGDCGSYKDWHKATVEELIKHFNHG